MPMIHVCDVCDTEIDNDTCKNHPGAGISSIWMHDEDYYRAEITRQEYDDNEQCEDE